MKVRCKPCNFVWTAAYLPMPAKKIATLLKGTRCPCCAATSRRIVLEIDDPPIEIHPPGQRKAAAA